jgi:lipid II:glycine glycyltransferase (peptidoglycan interpeptide bridge formation enzyme)
MLCEIADKNEWDKLYAQAPAASGKFLQSWQWGELQLALGRKIFRFADSDALALTVELPLPFGKKYWFCPKGPIGPIQDSELRIREFVEEIKNKATTAGAVFLRVEPQTPVIASGTKQSHDINPRATSIIDLSKTEEELLSAMHPKTRYNIKVAEKNGVTVGRWAVVSGKTFEEVMRLFSETAKRDGFRLHPEEYYQKQLEVFNEKTTFTAGVKSPHLVIFTAGVKDKMLAAAIVMFDGREVTYLHGASSSEMRSAMAPYALHWAIIKRAKERGYAHYDFWGISDNPSSGWAGITRFKRGWGGDDVSFGGTYDLPINIIWYNVYALARRLHR